MTILQENRTTTINLIMAANSFDGILRDLKAGRYAPVYFFAGEEPFYAQQLLDYIEHNALDEAGQF